LAAAWAADVATQARGREERLTEWAMAERREKQLKEAAKFKAVAVAREEQRAATFAHLLETSLRAVYDAVEKEVFDAELWGAVHETADKWEAQAEEAVDGFALELTVQQTLDALEKEVADDVVAEEWAASAADCCVDEILDFYFHREVGSKVSVEAALKHGLVLDAATRPPKAAGRKNLLLSLGPNGGGTDAVVEAACSKIQGIWRARKARKMLRKMLVAVWRKRWDENSACYFYENNLTGEVVWEAPRAFKMFFPSSDW
jgi:hypothetical protein